MQQREWSKAHEDFFEAFKNYDEAGSDHRIQCLKYYLMSHMLSCNEDIDKINPFDSQDLQAYAKHPEIIALTSLVDAYNNNDIHCFEKILKNNWKTIMDDEFIRSYIQDLLFSLRTQRLLELLKPYTSIQILFISQELNIPVNEVQELLVSLILDEKINAHIDQVHQLLLLKPRLSNEKKFASINRWVNHMPAVYQAIMNKLHTG